MLNRGTLFFATTNSSNDAPLLCDLFVQDPNKYWHDTAINEAYTRESERAFEEDREEDYEMAGQLFRPSYRNYPLHQAAIANDIESVLNLIEHTRRFTTREHNETALHVAALNNSLAVAEILINRNITQIDATDTWGETALHNAVYQNNTAMVKLLLKKGANPNHFNEYGLTPLHVAIAKLNWPMTRLLLNYGADLSLFVFRNNEAEEETSANLLEDVLRNARNDHNTETDLEEFTLLLIEYLCYGNQESNCAWGRNADDINQATRTRQFEVVDSLMTLVEDRAKLSDDRTGFSYYDDISYFDYLINYGSDDHDNFEEIMGMSDFVLEDAERINSVFNSPFFEGDKIEMLNIWCGIEDRGFYKQATPEQIEVLREYAESYNDEDALETLAEMDQDLAANNVY